MIFWISKTMCPETKFQGYRFIIFQRFHWNFYLVLELPVYWTDTLHFYQIHEGIIVGMNVFCSALWAEAWLHCVVAKDHSELWRIFFLTCKCCGLLPPRTVVAYSQESKILCNNLVTKDCCVISWSCRPLFLLVRYDVGWLG